MLVRGLPALWQVSGPVRLVCGAQRYLGFAGVSKMPQTTNPYVPACRSRDPTTPHFAGHEALISEIMRAPWFGGLSEAQKEALGSYLESWVRAFRSNKNIMA